MWESAVFWGAMALVAYGAVSAGLHIIALIHSLHQPARLVSYLVLVKDQADRVEGVVRGLAGKATADLLLVDLGSADESPAILQRLAVDYEHAWFFRWGTGDRSHAVATALSLTRAPFVVLIDLCAEMAKRGNS